MDNLEPIRRKIYEIRGQRVMLDFDLAELYGVTTGNLNKAVKRNIRRFPEEFMFQLTRDEFAFLRQSLIFQNGISNEELKVASGILRTGRNQNDINEFTRLQLENITLALAEMQAGSQSRKSRRKIGFIQDGEDTVTEKEHEGS